MQFPLKVLRYETVTYSRHFSKIKDSHILLRILQAIAILTFDIFFAENHLQTI